MHVETRDFAAVELRISGAGELPTIAGHGAVFGARSLDLGGYVEEIDPRAFDRTLKSGAEIRSFFNHSPMHVLGSTAAGTLRVAKDARGILFEVDPPDTTYARDLVASLRRKDVSGASFAFRVAKDSWRVDQDGRQVRTLLDVDLLELGPVVQPAYPDATSQVRALLEARGLDAGRILAMPARGLSLAECRRRLAEIGERIDADDRRAGLAQVRRRWATPAASRPALPTCSPTASREERRRHLEQLAERFGLPAPGSAAAELARHRPRSLSGFATIDDYTNARSFEPPRRPGSL